jgi:curved DNA-binding protein CbpA
MTEIDCYRILEIPSNATAEEIKKQYKKLVKKYHPDKTSGDKVLEEKLKLVTAAYQILSDPDKRKAYDQMQEAQRASQRPRPTDMVHVTPGWMVKVQESPGMALAALLVLLLILNAMFPKPKSKSY